MYEEIRLASNCLDDVEGCSAPAAQQPVQPAKPQVQPQVIKSWIGSGIKTTEPFTITNQPWFIRWSSNPTMMGGSSVGMLQIMVYDTKNPQLPITLAANTNEKKGDDSYIYQAGTFFLTMNAANTNRAIDIYAVP